MRKYFLLTQPIPDDLAVDAVATLLDRPAAQVLAVLTEQREGKDGYREFRVGQRTIQQPYPPLADLQRQVLERVLQSGFSPAACAGVRGRSFLDAARHHLDGETDVLRLDVQDAFGSARYGQLSAALRRRLKPELYAMGLSGEERKRTAGLVAHLLTAKHRTFGYRCLPTGAPSSVAAFNLLCATLDRDIVNWLHEQGETRAIYTRYVDDMVFSHVAPATLMNLPAAVGKLLRQRSMRLNDAKTLHQSGTRAVVYQLRRGVMGLLVGTLTMSDELRARLGTEIRQLTDYLAHPRIDRDARTRAANKLAGIGAFVQQIYGAACPAELVVDMPTAAHQRAVPLSIDEVWH